MDRSSVFRYPYNSKYVTTNPRDGLPDFTLEDNVNEFTTKTISCPEELQSKCCTDHKSLEEIRASETLALLEGDLGSDSTCPSTCTTRLCLGGYYCNSFTG